MTQIPRIGRTGDESVPFPKPQKKSGARAPNIVFWLIDDAGFGNFSPYGGLVDMPVMQRLADRGVTFSNAHVTPLCTPTRSSLMTGKNHHANHMSAVPRFSQGFPAHDSQIPREHGFVSEMLLEEGYATLCVGKWHLTGIDDMSMAASRKNWPLGRGFERFYGFMAGQTSQFAPHLVLDNHSLRRDQAFPEEYHLSEDMVDRSIEYIGDLRGGDAEKPFFLYLPFGATHAPHHAPREWIDRYKGKFDDGWDAYRETVHAQQKAKGLVVDGSPLSLRDPDVPAWDSLSAEQRRVSARYMEAFAGMASHMDHQVGRLMDYLEDIGELDNTVILVLADNGASSEGGATGAFNNQQFQGGIPQDSGTDEMIDQIGGPRSYNHYPWGWAWAGNTPFRRWKRETYRGGCAVPFVLSWPDGIGDHGSIRDQFVHVVDVVPTLLDLLKLEQPKQLNGVTQAAMDGVSFAAHLAEPDRPSDHITQYFEIMGHRSIYHDGWRAVAPWPGPSHKEAGRMWPAEITGTDMDRIEAEGWELYNVVTDPAETQDLAQTEPAMLAQLKALWWHEAGKYGVLPVLGRSQRPADADEMIAKPRSHVYFPATAPVFIETAANIINVDYRMTADLTVGDHPDGMLLAHGGEFGGYGFMVRDGLPRFVYNYLGIEQVEIVSETRLAPGRHKVEFEFTKTGAPDFARGFGAPGQGVLRIDGQKVGQGRLDRTVPVMLSFSGMQTCGYHLAEPFGEYDPPFTFGGVLHRVTVDINTPGPIPDDLAMETYLARQ
ncbi:arylsulfatase [Rhodophyticola sp. CCM32]|uniref:arylsulfatase n=1 Tax=Rhodophyticola sp. CCM32 TaxID=2916397 RepID=UPI00107F0EC8|nr:arylsulfatase [Rhodophyticola sp. CCM32]QBX99928.1 arylsulfatase [Rhodophyticola sp. CCM32]